MVEIKLSEISSFVDAVLSTKEIKVSRKLTLSCANFGVLEKAVEIMLRKYLGSGFILCCDFSRDVGGKEKKRKNLLKCEEKQAEIIQQCDEKDENWNEKGNCNNGKFMFASRP